jgi:hypothetical protein
MNPDGLVSEALEEYRIQNKVGKRSYQKKRFIVGLGPIKLDFPNPGKLPLHDLHHVATGYAANLCGEIEISAFEWRAGSLTPLIALLCLGSFFIGLFYAPRRMAAAWRASRDCSSLYDLEQDYESLLTLPVHELRALLNIPRPGLAVKKTN